MERKNAIVEDTKNWKVIKRPEGKLYTNNNNNEGKVCGTCKIEDILFGGDPLTEFRSNWYKEIGYSAFPHEFTIDFGKKTKFSFVKLTGAWNQGMFKMDSHIEIMTADTEEELNETTSMIYEGKYVSTSNIIDLRRVVEGRFMEIRVLDNSIVWKNKNPGRTDFAGIDVGLKRIHVKRMDIPRGCKWQVRKSAGYGINGRYFIGKAGDSYEITVPSKALQFGFIGAKFDGMGSATVYQDGEKVATINKNLITAEDRTNLKLASKSYMQPLFISNKLIKPTTFKLSVDSGEIWLTGILTDDGSGNDFDPFPEESGGGGESGGSGNNDGQGGKDKDKGSDQKGGMKTGGIVGIVIGVLVFVVAAVVGVFIVVKRFSKKESSADDLAI